MDKHIEIMSKHFDISGSPMTAQLFGKYIFVCVPDLSYMFV